MLLFVNKLEVFLGIMKKNCLAIFLCYEEIYSLPLFFNRRRAGGQLKLNLFKSENCFFLG